MSRPPSPASSSSSSSSSITTTTTTTTTALDHALQAALSRRRAAQTLRTLTLPPRGSTDFSSNDFLSLATNEELQQRFQHELDAQQQQQQQHRPHLGSGGSRLLDGNSAYAEALERDIAAFHGAASGLLCNSGFDANVGLFACLPQPGDVVVYDECVHASVHDGMRVSRASRALAFGHNSVEALRRVLAREVLGEGNAGEGDEEGARGGMEGGGEQDAQRRLREGSASVFVAVEAVYSMDGDVAPLREMVALLREVFPRGNAHLIVDEAHSNGVFGAQGRGLVSALGLEGAVAVRLHTFGKALACNGAILLCRPLIRQYLLNYARPLIYTTFMSFPCLAAIRAAYGMLMAGRTEALVQDLRAGMTRLHVRLLAMQDALGVAEEEEEREEEREEEGERRAETSSSSSPSRQRSLLRCPEVCPQTPIFAVWSTEPKALAAYCQQRGFVVRAIVPPTVAPGTERVRICLHAGNTARQIDALVECIREWAEGRMREVRVSAAEVRARL